MTYSKNIPLYFMINATSQYSSLVFFSSRRRHTRWPRDWSSDVCSSDLDRDPAIPVPGCSRCRMVHRRDRQVRTTDPEPPLPECGEGLRRGHLMDQVQIDIEDRGCLLTLQPDEVCLPDLLEECAWSTHLSLYSTDLELASTALGALHGEAIRLEESAQIRVIYTLLPITEHLESLEDLVQSLPIEFVSEFTVALGESAPARVLTEDETVRIHPNHLRCHDLVSQGVLDHPILMDPRLMCEGVLAYDRLVRLWLDPRDLGQELARRVELLGHDPRLVLEGIGPDPERHHDLL